MANEADDSKMQDAEGLLFADRQFVIVTSDKLTADDVEEIKAKLTDNGGVCTTSSDHAKIPHFEKVDYIVSGTTDFPDYYDALDQFRPVVRPKYIDACIRSKELESPRNYSPDPALFMSDVLVFCADLPERDKDAICGAIQGMGGQYSARLSKFVTHLVALNFENSSCELAIKKNLSCSIVLPHWFDACFKLGRRIPETPFLLADPQILNPEAKAPRDTPTSDLELRGAASPRPKHTKPPHTGPARKVSVFQNKKVMLSSQLDLGHNITNAIEEIVTDNGGKMVSEASHADMLVCQYRDGDDYITASRAGKDVGNLSWLYYIISHNRWTSPMRRLLHYPVPRHGIPGFRNHQISLSNYSGEARTYVSSLVEATGASLDKKLTSEKTHLIAAYKDGAKCDAAEEWGVMIVNHLWLEESYAKCKEMPITKREYTHFPKCTNLGVVVGQTPFDRAALERNYFSDDIVRKTNGTKKAPVDADVTEDEAEDIDAEEPEDVVSKPTPARRDRPSKTAVSTPKPRLSSDKENESPLTTGGRAAKAKAASKLHNMAPDIALFEKESKRKGGVTHGKERKSVEEEEAAIAAKSKRSAGTTREIRKRSLETDADEEEEEERAKTPPKKTKTTKKAGKSAGDRTYLMVTAYSGWVNNAEKEAKDKTKLEALGYTVTLQPRPSMILCAPNIVRTKKFLCALALAPQIVSLSFLDALLSSTAANAPDPSDYPLIDADSESKWGMDLESSLRRAVRNPGKLLKDYTVFATEMNGQFATYKEIVEANGGVCQLYKGRTSMNVSKRLVRPRAKAATAESQDLEGGAVPEDAEEKEEMYLIGNNAKKEIPLWEKFRLLARNVDMRPRIVSTEWLLTAALRQKVVAEERWELREETAE